jgi:CheY-like chemotaxis protein
MASGWVPNGRESPVTASDWRCAGGWCDAWEVTPGIVRTPVAAAYSGLHCRLAGCLSKPRRRCFPPLPPKRPLRVLLVDDVAANREIARGILIERGHDVTAAKSGTDAVQLATDNNFDVVLMDMRMPGMDGVEATKRIRMIADGRGQVPIVAVTANALDQQIIEGRRAGMVEHLVKPFTAEELLAVVTRVARRSSSAQPCEPPTFDPDVLTQLAPYMSSGEMERHLLDLAHKVETLLRAMEGVGVAPDPGAVADLAHEMAGMAGVFGFAELAAAARCFDAALLEKRGSAADLSDALTVAARAALAELRGLTAPEPVGLA